MKKEQTSSIPISSRVAEYVAENLNQAKLACTPINILLLGPVRVGKTTLIHIIACLGLCKDFDASKISSACYATEQRPSDPKINIKAKLGNPSDTDKPQIYELNFDGNIYNFIDTPGSGELHNSNRQITVRTHYKIMRALSDFSKIHAIWMIVDASKNFSDSASEIEQNMKIIGKEALKNLFFIFIKSSEQQDKSQVLKRLQKWSWHNMELSVKFRATKKNTFFIDSKGFQIVRQNFSRSRFADELNKKNWISAREQMSQMLDCVPKIKPHAVKNSMALKKFHVLNTVKNKSKFFKMPEKFLQFNFENDDLDYLASVIREELQCAEYDVKRIVINTRSIVCTNPACVDVVKEAGSDSYTIHYKQVCHAGGVVTGLISGKEIVESLEMGNRFCKACYARGHRCLIVYHYEINYEQKIFARTTELTKALDNVYAAPDPMAAMKLFAQKLKKEFETISNWLPIFKNFGNQQDIYHLDNSFIENVRNKFMAPMDLKTRQNLSAELHDIDTKYKQSIEDEENDDQKDGPRLHAEQKQDLEKIEKLSSAITRPETISADRFLETCDELFKLEFCGPKLQELYYKHFGYADKDIRIERVLTAKTSQTAPRDSPP